MQLKHPEYMIQSVLLIDSTNWPFIKLIFYNIKVTHCMYKMCHCH